MICIRADISRIAGVSRAAGAAAGGRGDGCALGGDGMLFSARAVSWCGAAVGGAGGGERTRAGLVSCGGRGAIGGLTGTAFGGVVGDACAEGGGAGGSAI